MVTLSGCLVSHVSFWHGGADAARTLTQVNDNPNLSVTNLTHHLLETLEESPFGGLYAVGYDGKSECYDLDLFRRLYNDAVESMHGYQALAATLGREADIYRLECDRLENCLREICDD